MNGVFIMSGAEQGVVTGGASSTMRLLFKHGDVEVMYVSSKPGATIWISPGEDKALAEYYYLLRGTITLSQGGEKRQLVPGDGFYAAGLTEDVRVDSPRGCEMMYVATKPVFDEIFSFQADLQDILRRIDEKDNVTLAHSYNVMRYTVALADRLGWEKVGLSADDLVTAALFHDVGKCYVPDEILKKTGRLTAEEYERMKEHAAGTQALRQRFGDLVADTAMKHHERLDGSGYPAGLAGDDIPLSSRVIAVADAFDAMTAGRVYAPAKSASAAARELCTLPDVYDAAVVRALCDLLAEGALDKILDKTEGKQR